MVKLYRMFVVFLLAIILTCSLTTSSPAMPKRMVVVGDSSYAPFEFLNSDGDACGISVDIWRLWSDKTGIEVDYRLMNWAKALEEMRTGEADVIGGIFYNTERDSFLDYASSYYEIETNIFFHSDVLGIRDVSDLAGFKKIGVVDGDFSESYMNGKVPDSVLISYSGNKDMVKSAISGEIRVFIADSPVANYYLAQLGTSKMFKKTQKPVYKQKLWAAVPEGETELLDTVKSGFDEISNSEIETVVDRWVGVHISRTIPWKVMVGVLILIILGVFSVLIWNYQLRYSVRNATKSLLEKQRELEESERKYRLISENAHDIISLHTSDDASYLYINPYSVNILGYTEEELLGKSAFEFVHPEDRDYVRREYEKCVDIGTAVVEYRFTKNNGKNIWIESTGRFVVEGEDEYVLVISRDVTSRKKAEEALIKSQQFYRALIEKQGEGIIIADRDEVITYCNEAAEKIFGTEKGELVGSNLKDYLSDETYDFVLQQTQKRLQGEKSTYEIEIIRPSGEKRFILVSAAPWYGKDDNIIGAFGIIRDETERKKAENELAAEKERLHVTLLSIAEGVITTDMKGIVTSINKSAQKLLEWESNHALGKHIEEIYRYEESDAERYTFISKILDSRYQVLQQEEAIILSQTGEEIMISESIAPIKDQKSEIIGAVVVFRDIRDKKMLEVLEEKIRQAEKLQSLSLFAGGIAHDFNNMMTGIMCNIALAKLYVNPSEKAYSVLTEAEKGFSRAKDLTQQLMTFAKSGSPTKKLGSITEILKDTVKFTLSGSNVKSDFKIDEDISSAEFDNGQMSQVFSNLTINAQQAMQDGGKLHVVAENVYVSDDDLLPLSEGKYVKISFIDEGVGISEENKRRIFDPYFTTKKNGSGLGLANVFSIVEKHHGYIDVESEVDKGTTFSLYLPAKEGDLPRKEESSSGSIKGSGRILLMDDEEVIRKTAGDLLHRIGFKVKLARNGKEAIELYQKEMNNSKSFDAVILDLTIPAGMGGLECLHALKQIDPDVKAIVSSGYSNDPIIANYKNHGFEGVIIKPYIIDEFYETINRILGEN